MILGFGVQGAGRGIPPRKCEILDGRETRATEEFRVWVFRVQGLG